MVFANFQIEDNEGRAWFSQKTLLLADISINVLLGMPFLTFSNVGIQFAEEKLTWRSYTTTEAFSTNQKVELINKKEFAKTALDETVEAFVVYMASFTSEMWIYLAREA